MSSTTPWPPQRWRFLPTRAFWTQLRAGVPPAMMLLPIWSTIALAAVTIGRNLSGATILLAVLVTLPLLLISQGLLERWLRNRPGWGDRPGLVTSAVLDDQRRSLSWLLLTVAGGAVVTVALTAWRSRARQAERRQQVKELRRQLDELVRRRELLEHQMRARAATPAGATAHP